MTLKSRLEFETPKFRVILCVNIVAWHEPCLPSSHPWPEACRPYLSCHLLQTATPWLFFVYKGFLPRRRCPGKKFVWALEARLGPFGERILEFSEHGLKRMQVSYRHVPLSLTLWQWHGCRRVRMGSFREPANSCLLQWSLAPLHRQQVWVGLGSGVGKWLEGSKAHLLIS